MSQSRQITATFYRSVLTHDYRLGAYTHAAGNEWMRSKSFEHVRKHSEGAPVRYEVAHVTEEISDWKILDPALTRLARVEAYVEQCRVAGVEPTTANLLLALNGEELA